MLRGYLAGEERLISWLMLLNKMDNLKKQISRIFKPFTSKKVDVERTWFVFVYIMFSVIIVFVALHLALFFVINGIKDENFSEAEGGMTEPINEKAIKEIILKFNEKENSYNFIDQEMGSIKDPSQ